jgi:hypothetical protein
MKTKSISKICGVGLLALHMTILPSFAGDSIDTRAIKAALTSVPTLEMPAKAAALVKQAPTKQSEAMTKEVVLAAVKLNAPATVSVVGAIAKENTQAASVAAGTAASKMPKQAAAIARAAATSAPSQAGKIVEAVCKVAFRDYKAVALAVAQVVPAAGKEILDAVAVAVPSTKSYIASAQSYYANTSTEVSVSAVLQQMEVAQSTSGSVAGFDPLLSPPPVQGAPFVPFSGTPTEITPQNSAPLPSGGRHYSGP